MAGFVSSVGLVVMLKALMCALGQRGVFVGMMLLVTVTAAGSTVAGKQTPVADSHNLYLVFLGNYWSVFQRTVSYWRGALTHNEHLNEVCPFRIIGVKIVNATLD